MKYPHYKIQYNRRHKDNTFNDFTYKTILITLNTGDITHNDITYH